VSRLDDDIGIEEPGADLMDAPRHERAHGIVSVTSADVETLLDIIAALPHRMPAPVVRASDAMSMRAHVKRARFAFTHVSFPIGSVSTS
jgi:hypothetical protein